MKIVDPVRGLGPLTRPLYQQGLLLQDDDLTAAVQYTRDLNRLLFRTLFGCGVMCGLVVTPTLSCCKLHIGISKGVALDCHGDAIDVAAAQDIEIDPNCLPALPDTLWVVLCAYEKNCAPRMPLCPDEDDSTVVCTRAREGFEIKVLSDASKCCCQCDPSTDKTPAAPQLESFSSHPPLKSGAARQAKRHGSSGEVKPLALEDATGQTSDGNPCQCANPNEDCYTDHYAGNCACDCCDCECVVLARLDHLPVDPQQQSGPKYWAVNHAVRRFVRPVLVKDPQPLKDAAANAAAQAAASS
jgi:hypothetical protein